MSRLSREEAVRRAQAGKSLEGAYLQGADLRVANLEKANLRVAYLYQANLIDDLDPSNTIIPNY